ncbi:hypothetical protein FACS1894103_3370 [Campylobacterota bacterium]|nr:hypothetical protein FACS1894103_3370 [Campylobacterota bacterium]
MREEYREREKQNQQDKHNAKTHQMPKAKRVQKLIAKRDQPRKRRSLRDLLKGDTDLR